MRFVRELFIGVILNGLILVSAWGGEPGPDDASAASWISRGLEEESRLDPLAALACFRKAEALGADGAFVLQKIAQQLSDAAFLENDPVETERMAREALGYARRAAQLDPESAVNRLSLAVLYGRLAGYGDTRTKVDYAQRIKNEAEAALEIDADYAWAYHVLGRWHLEMSEIGGVKRLLASLFFGGLSRPSVDAAVELLEQAVELEPDSIAHRVELGFAYYADGQGDRAREQWALGLRLDSRFLYDSAAKERARQALEVSEMS